MSYTVLINDEERGPYSIENLIAYVKEGLIKPDTQARLVDSGEWWEVSAIIYQYQKNHETIAKIDHLSLKNKSDVNNDSQLFEGNVKSFKYSKTSLFFNINIFIKSCFIFFSNYISGFKYESQAPHLALAVIVFVFSSFIAKIIRGLFESFFAFWTGGAPFPPIYSLAYFFACYDYIYVIFSLSLVALSLIANRKILNQNKNNFVSTNNYLFSLRFHINFFGRLVSIILVFISILLSSMTFCGLLSSILRVEQVLRYPLIACLYGENATIVTTTNGTKKFAPTQIYSLLDKRIPGLNSDSSNKYGEISYKNVSYKNDYKYFSEEWFFEVKKTTNYQFLLLYECRAFRGKYPSGWSVDVKLVEKSDLPAN